MSQNDRSRRSFIKVCGATLAAVAGVSTTKAVLAGPRRSYSRVALVDGNDRPLTCDTLPREQEFVFHYPYESTPCFLIKLGAAAAGPVSLETEDGTTYRWAGGVGPDRSVVSFSAICAHRLTHPTRAVSFIGYRQELRRIPEDIEVTLPAGGVIQCCSEHSIYDPAMGARVISGPAPQPLAAVELGIDADGALFVAGVYGGMLFDRYFDEFGFRLALEYGEDAVRSPVSDRVVALPIEEYTTNRVSC